MAAAGGGATSASVAAAAASEPVAAKGIQDIQAIEEKVIVCVEIASEVAAQLSEIGSIDKARVAALCTEFLQNIQVAQALVHEGIKKSVINKAFEASSYHARMRATIAMEKICMVGEQVAAMQAVLQASGAAGGAGAGAGEAAAAEEAAGLDNRGAAYMQS